MLDADESQPLDLDDALQRRRRAVMRRGRQLQGEIRSSVERVRPPENHPTLLQTRSQWAEARKARLDWETRWSRLWALPGLGALLRKVQAKQHKAFLRREKACRKMHQDAYGSLMASYREQSGKKLKSRHGTELSSLKAALALIDELEAGLRTARDNGHVLPPIYPSRGWMEDLARHLAELANLFEPVAAPTVINDGKDHSNLDLSPRSKPIAMRLGKIEGDKPWLRVPADKRPFFADGHLPPGGLAGHILHGASAMPPPPSLYGLRERRSIPLLPGSYSTAKRFYLPVAYDRITEVVATGAQVGKKKGFHIDPLQIDCSGPVIEFMPFIAKRWYLPLRTDPIPSTSWGASLANLLTPGSWDEIRLKVADPYGHLCSICGQLKNGTHIECHEIWDYYVDTRVEHFAVQRLVGIVPVCKACHGVFHQGFSAMRGHADQAQYRLADINGWSMGETEQALAWMAHCHRARSRQRWALDLSLVSDHVLTINSKWDHDDAGRLRAGTPSGKTSTMLLGVNYRMGSRGEIVEGPASPLRA